MSLLSQKPNPVISFWSHDHSTHRILKGEEDVLLWLMIYFALSMNWTLTRMVLQWNQLFVCTPLCNIVTQCWYFDWQFAPSKLQFKFQFAAWANGFWYWNIVSWLWWQATLTSVSKREEVISLWSSGYRNEEINQAHEILKYSRAYLPTPHVLQLISPLDQQYPIL